MANATYLPRIIDDRVENYLNAFGAVCIEGPKWCGKTWTSAHHSKSAFYLTDPANNFRNRQLVNFSLDYALQGGTPRLIDEWQEYPQLWDAVRMEVDKRADTGQFILTGSSTPAHKGILHSGAGRIAKISMHTMSLYEAGKSTGEVSLKDVCESREIKPGAVTDSSLEQLAEYIICGGWPASVTLPFSKAKLIPEKYLQAVLDEDIYKLDEINHNVRKMELLLRSLARNESTTVSIRKLCDDISENETATVDAKTVAGYLDVFKRLFITDNQQPFSTNIRSSVRIKQAEKRHFCDPSLAACLLKSTVSGLINDLKTFGFLFEALCERDLRIYAESMGANLYHYRDYADNEIDAVIELEDGNWCAFEIKLGAHQTDAAAKQLIKLKNKISEEGGKLPAVLGVITGTSNFAHKREDGVCVIPITALKN